MMAISMYQVAVPTFVRMLTNLDSILEKATAHSQAKKIDETVLLKLALGLRRRDIRISATARDVVESPPAADARRSGEGRNPICCSSDRRVRVCIEDASAAAPTILTKACE